MIRKKKSVVEDIKSLILERYVDKARNRVQCGIIYCLSRNECEKVAKDLAELFAVPGLPRLVIR